VGIIFFGDVETHACREESPEHMWEGENKKASPAKSVNCPNGRPGKDKIHQSKAEGGKDCADIASACLREDRRRIEGDDID
jgi:hypothetical protein